MEKIPPLVGIDWVIIIAFFITTLCIGLYYSKRATGSLMDYFVAGRKMTWWLAGTSIVATSFAADTPLVISGWMRSIGLERNWFWWGGIMGMMLCTFFFARLWRRAELITDVEFNELRYSGKPAVGLRIFHASYRSVIQNTLTMGWVTLAMTKIIDVTLNIPTLVFLKGSFLPETVTKGADIASQIDMSMIMSWPIIGEAIIPAKAIGIIVCLSVAAFYSTISGLWGVIATDFFQFIFAMTGTIILMFIVFFIAGGPVSMVNKAKRVVLDGKVVNKQPYTRNLVDRGHVLEIVGTETELTKLTTAGLLVPSLSTDNKLRWNVDGISEDQLSASLIHLNVSGITKVMELWRKAYTISKVKFTDFDEVEKMLGARILFYEKPASGKIYEYYRLASINHENTKFTSQLDAVGVENKSEIMAAFRDDRVVAPAKITSFFPPFDLKGGGLMAIWALVVFLGLQWWAGGEGGGFLAQRLFSCKNEKHSVLAMLWFSLAHFVLRPWPWIVVGIASLFLVPDITAFGKHYDQEHVYAIMLMKYLPTGLKGLMVASLAAAYMSTISTHVNFGASYIVNDLYCRFIDRSGNQSRQVLVSKIASVFLAVLGGVCAYFMKTIDQGWFLMFELMSGSNYGRTGILTKNCDIYRIPLI